MGIEISSKLTFEDSNIEMIIDFFVEFFVVCSAQFYLCQIILGTQTFIIRILIISQICLVAIVLNLHLFPILAGGDFLKILQVVP